MNSSGKIFTVFIIIIAVLLISLTAISIFFFQKEAEKGVSLERALVQSKKNEVKLEEDIKEAKKQIFLLEEKNKESDERINSLLDELELEKGLREEMKLETSSFQAQIDEQKKAKELAENKLQEAQGKVQELEGKLAVELSRRKEFEERFVQVEKKNKQLEDRLFQLGESVGVKDLNALSQAMEAVEKEIDLEKIVVDNREGAGGRVLSVDTDTEFVIINLGSKDGLALGEIMSVYRGEEYLGDIKITRVQAEMSAADLIPPFSSQRVRKNDQVVRKDDS